MMENIVVVEYIYESKMRFFFLLLYHGVGEEEGGLSLSDEE